MAEAKAGCLHGDVRATGREGKLAFPDGERAGDQATGERRWASGIAYDADSKQWAVRACKRDHDPDPGRENFAIFFTASSIPSATCAWVWWMPPKERSARQSIRYFCFAITMIRIRGNTVCWISRMIQLAGIADGADPGYRSGLCFSRANITGLPGSEEV